MNEVIQIAENQHRIVISDIRAKLADEIREAEKALKEIDQSRFIIIGKLQALRAMEAWMKWTSKESNLASGENREIKTPSPTM